MRQLLNQDKVYKNQSPDLLVLIKHTEISLDIVDQVAGVMRQDIIQQMLDDPTMLDELDHLYKTDSGRKMLFYYQVIKSVSIGVSRVDLYSQKRLSKRKLTKEIEEEDYRN